MSLFGYPATVTHYHSELDEWGRPQPATSIQKAAKVVEEQKLIKNAHGEEVLVSGELHLEGPHVVSFDDYFEYRNAVGLSLTYEVAHIEVKKFLGTDDVKKVIVYGRPQHL